MISSKESFTLFLLVLASGIESIVNKKLTLMGTFVAIALGLSVSLSGFEYFCIMIAFYISANIATEKNNRVNSNIVGNHKDSKPRSASQVIYKGLFPSVISLIIYIKYEGKLDLSTANINRQILQSMYIAFYCFSTADTWASEIGMIGSHKTYFILTGKLIPKGVNGGISVKGTIMSVLGGGFIGLVSILCWVFRFGANEIKYSIIIHMLIIGCFWGFIGSMIDSLIGATLQESIYDITRNKVIPRELKNKENSVMIYGRNILDNGQVNLFSGITTSFIALIMNLLFI